MGSSGLNVFFHNITLFKTVDIIKKINRFSLTILLEIIIPKLAIKNLSLVALDLNSFL